MPLKATLIAKMYESHVQSMYPLSLFWLIHLSDVLWCQCNFDAILEKKNICIVVKGGESCRNELNQVEKVSQNPI